MKYLKLFENYTVDEGEYPENAHDLSLREKKILENLVGDFYLAFNVKKDDGYYYTKYVILYSDNFYNRFDNFSDLKDYIKFTHFILKDKPDSFLELLRDTKLDMSFDDNIPIRWAIGSGKLEIVKQLLKDPRVDPSAENNGSIIYASLKGHTEIVKLLLADPRVDPSVDDNYAIIYASSNGHTEIVKLLLEDPRVRKKLSPWEINKYTNETY